MSGAKLDRMFELLRDRCATAETKREQIRNLLTDEDPAALRFADALKKNTTPELLGSVSRTRNWAASDFGTFAAKAAKD